jgi:ABC-type sugar transport system ATPase subunit
VGNPPMNMIPVSARIADEHLTLAADGLTLAGLALSQGIRAALARSTNLTLGVRPEHLTLMQGSEGTIAGRLFANENMGPESLVTLERADGSRITARLFTDEHVPVGEDVRFGFSEHHVTLFDADGRRIPADGEGAL